MESAGAVGEAGGAGGEAPGRGLGNTPPANPTRAVRGAQKSGDGGRWWGLLAPSAPVEGAHPEWWAPGVGVYTLTEADAVELAQIETAAESGELDPETAAAYREWARRHLEGPAPRTRSPRVPNAGRERIAIRDAVHKVAEIREVNPGAFSPGQGMVPAYLAGLAADVDAAELEARAAECEAFEDGGATSARAARLADLARDLRRDLDGASRAGVRLVAAGIDSLYVSIWAVVASPVLGRLAELRALAERSDEPVYVGTHALRWRLAPHGAAGGFGYLLDGPACSIALRRANTAGQAIAYCQVRAEWLWRVGADRCIDVVVATLGRWSLGACTSPRVTVGRLDLCVDVQGWEPRGDELHGVRCGHCHGLPASAWVTRAQNRSVYSAAGSDDDAPTTRSRRDQQREEDAERQDRLYLRGVDFNGFAFGQGGTVSARVYRKTAEVKIHRKRWFHAIWQAGGYDPDVAVWRIEFQLRRDALAKAVAATSRRGAELATGHDWAVVRGSLDGIWSYLTGRDGRGWLSLRVRGADQKRADRWPVVPAWRAISQVRWGERSVWARVAEPREATPAQVAALDACHARRPSSEPRPPTPTTDAGRPDADAIARIVGRASTIAYQGEGPRTAGDQVAAAGVVLLSASERASALLPGLVGTLAAWAAAEDVARGRPIAQPATDLEEVDRVLSALRAAVERGQRVSELRHSLASSIRSSRYRLAAVQAVRADLQQAVAAASGDVYREPTAPRLLLGGER